MKTKKERKREILVCIKCGESSEEEGENGLIYQNQIEFYDDNGEAVCGRCFG